MLVMADGEFVQHIQIWEVMNKIMHLASSVINVFRKCYVKW